MISKNSRYEYSIIDYFALDKNADVHPVLFYPMPDIGTINYFEYAVIKGDRLDLIAKKFYGDPSVWWFILQKNPQIKDPNNIPVGTVIKIEAVGE
jgi:hypothetical protein